jgi:hypothetical protein
MHEQYFLFTAANGSQYKAVKTRSIHDCKHENASQHTLNQFPPHDASTETLSALDTNVEVNNIADENGKGTTGNFGDAVIAEKATDINKPNETKKK